MVHSTKTVNSPGDEYLYVMLLTSLEQKENKLLVVEECPGKSLALRDNSGHSFQISDLTQLSCNHCNPSFIYIEFLGLKFLCSSYSVIKDVYQQWSFSKPI